MPTSRDPARDLLFGLVALQNGFIDQSRLVAAFQAWRLDKARPMAELLQSQGAIDADQRGLLESLAGKILELHGGDPAKGLASIHAGWSTRRSLLAIGDSDLEDGLSHVPVAEIDHDHDDDSFITRVSVETLSADRLRFRVLRPHAHGGLGAVYVALDTELHREVALKQILDDHADDPTSRQRFLIEAEITGGLEHPGIVPVYGLGTYSDGRPYYAMRFIKGDSLKDAITRFHHPAGSAARTDPDVDTTKKVRAADPVGLELRRLLRRFLDVCNALHYAHARGVVHRDIKPGNIIVGKYGETLVVDWGLAKARGLADPDSAERPLSPASASGSAETLPGKALGTPSYMSPEQARGELDHVDARSDVYSLGATLYHLLTGQPPFVGDLTRILQSVESGAIVSPRRHDPSIDPALEAVCLKAMRLRPEDRYPTARALADDVERWLGDEPVTAWREPFARRARRWMKRNRTAVTAAAASVVVALVGLTSVLVVQGKANAKLATQNDALVLANRKVSEANADLAVANGRERQRFDLAREAIKAFTDGVEDDETLKNPDLERLRARLLGRAREFYQKLEEQLQGRTDRRSLEDLASAYLDLGLLTSAIDDNAAALGSLLKALAIRQRIADAASGDASAQRDLARSGLKLGDLLGDTGRHDAARDLFDTARTIEERLVAADPADPVNQRDLATCHNELGSLLKAMKRDEEALAAFETARTIRQRLADQNPRSTQFQSDLASSHNNIGLLLYDQKKAVASLVPLENARAIRERLAGDNPEDLQLQNELAGTYNNIGRSHEAMSRNGPALEAYRKSLAIRQRLADQNPALIQYRSDLARVQNNMGIFLRRTNHPAEAFALFKTALAARERLVAANPTVVRFQLDLAATYNNLGNLFRMLARPDDALASYQKCLEIEQRLVDAHPSVPKYRRDASISHYNIAAFLRDRNRTDEARARFLQALAMQQRLADDYPTDDSFATDLARTQSDLGDLLVAKGRTDEARAVLEKALAIQEGLARKSPESDDDRTNLAKTLDHLGRLEIRRQRWADARARLEPAIALQRAALKSNDRNTQYRQVMASLLADLSKTALAQHVPGEAASAALELTDWAIDDASRLYQASGLLAACAREAADPADARRFADAARASLTKAVAAGSTEDTRSASDPDLAPLYDPDEVRRLVARLFDAIFPADPFAN